MKIALIADPHLSDITTVPQEESLNWALDTISQLSPAACLWLGDITACGAEEAALRFLDRVKELPFPSVIVPGNAELRTTSTANTLERILHTHLKGLTLGDLTIVGMNTSHNTIAPEERNRLSGLALQKNVLIISHQPAKYLDADSLNFLSVWFKKLRKAGHRILLWASGHRHVYGTGTFEDVPTVSLRALDLDKCIGGTPQVCIWDSETENIEEICYRSCLPHEWSHEERTEFSDLLGITCYEEHKLTRDMPFAIRQGVRHLEWKNIHDNEIPLIEQWRRAGGKTFSLHMSAMDFDRTVTGLEKFRRMATAAVHAGADTITVHPPFARHEIMYKDSPAFCAVADAMAEALLPVAGNGIQILIENSHTGSDIPSNPSKFPFGCTPMDLFDWQDALNTRLGTGSCHLRLDVGHARNNEPISEAFPIGKWYALIGSHVKGYHLHQTIFNRAKRIMENHHPILDWSGDMISYCGFLWAWHCGILHHGPMILEIREGEGACDTWLRLQRLITEA